MRRLGLVLLMMVMALVVSSGVAIAAVKFGTDGRNELIGTNSADQLFGKGASDFLAGKKQDDVLYGGDENDFIHGGAVGWGMAPTMARTSYWEGMARTACSAGRKTTF